MSLDESSNIHAKVADFGLAHKLTPLLGVMDRLETWQWMAPEAFGLSSRLYNEKADVYSFAIILWEICTREFPFSEYFNKYKQSVFKLKDEICRGIFLLYILFYIMFSYWQSLPDNDPLRPTFPPACRCPDGYGRFPS